MAQKKSALRKPVKVLVTLILLIALVAGGYHFWQGRKQAEEQATKVSVVTVARGDIEEVVTAQGKLEPKDFVDVGVQVSGQIRQIKVELGDIVKKGDLIAEIDPKIYEAKVEADEARIKTLQAQIAQQDAQVTLVNQQYQRTQKLLQAKAVSQDAFDSADAALKIAKAQRDALDAQLQEAQSALDGDKANLGYTSIYAPMDGTVVIKDAKEGQTLNATQSAPRVVQLASLDVMTVRAQVAEADVMRIREGGDVYFTTLGASGRKWTGKVRQVLPTPDVVNEVVLYNVLVDAENKDRQLMTGMSTQMFFVMGRAQNVPLVPISALGKRAQKEDREGAVAYRIKVPAGAKDAEKIIHVGLMDRQMAEVKGGLAEGDKVIMEAPAAGDPMAGVPRRMRNMAGRL
ncbi:MAG TPA: efflux RND transporter periplasmic adaptor subunit [Patescibacteria group bacterium]|nr:efflux RND transporter periplasmic adaptor subunit [Patescibacteria group bacterium]